MLYAQIPSSLQKKIALDLNIDVKLLGSGVGAVLKHKEQEETRYSKLKLVLRYLEDQQAIGWIDAPKEYFQGTLSMRWGLFPEKDKPYQQGLAGMLPGMDHPHIAFFGGSTNRTIVGLAGSPKHVLGYEGAETEPQSIGSPSAFPYVYFQFVVEHEAAAQPPEGAVYNETRRIPLVVKKMGGMASNLDFVAKTISHTPYREPYAEEFILLGSPLYVALT